jgi:hypothetical protein
MSIGVLARRVEDGAWLQALFIVDVERVGAYFGPIFISIVCAGAIEVTNCPTPGVGLGLKGGGGSDGGGEESYGCEEGW